MMRTDETFEVTKSEEEWRKQLTPEQYHALVREASRYVYVRRLRTAALQVRTKVRERHRLAEFL